MIPETRYAETPDGVYIAYQVTGEGPLDLAWQFDFTGNVDIAWEEPGFESWFERPGLDVTTNTPRPPRDRSVE